MVLSLAMCASVAFAQTNLTPKQATLNRHAVSESMDVKVSKQAPQAKVDYKASIFTKDAVFDTVRTFRFTQDEYNSLSFGVLQQGDHIFVDGRDSTISTAANTIDQNSYPWARWKYYSDSVSFMSNYVNDYAALNGYFLPQNDPGYLFRYIGSSANANDPGYSPNDGFMVFGYNSIGRNNYGNINVWMQLPTVHRSATQQDLIVLIGVNQCYRAFADRCFIDYVVTANGGTQWHTREINVKGVDVEVNGSAAAKQRFVMPFNLSSENDVTIRFRAYSSLAGGAATYGYGWALDNVAVIVDNREDSWTFSLTAPIEGLYGMMPQNMHLPVAYGVNVQNTGVNNLTNAKLTLSSGPYNGTFTQDVAGTPKTLVAGDPLVNQTLYIDERGVVNDTLDFRYDIHGWPTEGAHYGQSHTPEGGHVKTNTLGANGFFFTAQGGSLSYDFDTILYTVSDDLEATSSRMSGYRWGRDNGLVPAGSSFQVSYSEDGYIDQSDMDDDGSQHSSMLNYQVMVRFVTGDQVPSNMAIRGIEYVPATDIENGSTMVTAGNSGVIAPVLYEETATESGFRFSTINVGLDGVSYKVLDAHVNNRPTTGYRLPSNDEATYSVLDIPFLQMPALKPNTAYHVGYRLTGGTQFHVAAQRASFKNDTAGWTSYRTVAETAPYANQITPQFRYDVYVIDGQGHMHGDESTNDITAWNVDVYPMIRLVLGEPDEVETVSVLANCQNPSENEGISVRHGSNELCGSDDGEDVAVSSNNVFVVSSLDDHTVIDAVYVNGVEVPVYDENDDDPQPGDIYMWVEEDNVTDTVGTGSNMTVRDRLFRNYYQIVFNGIADNPNGYVITADYRTGVEWIEVPEVGIDQVAPEFAMSLYPNPATSTVKLSMAGVEGMVNCNIIDMSGRVIYNARVNSEAETTIDVSNIPAGAYFVRITNDTFSKIEKLIIK